MKSFARGQSADGAGRRAAGADPGNGGQGAAHGFKVHAAVERQQGRLIEVDGGLEYPLDIAGQNDSRIDELAALDARHDPHDRIVIGAKIAHASPPLRRFRKIAAAA